MATIFFGRLLPLTFITISLTLIFGIFGGDNAGTETNVEHPASTHIGDDVKGRNDAIRKGLIASLSVGDELESPEAIHQFIAARRNNGNEKENWMNNANFREEYTIGKGNNQFMFISYAPQVFKALMKLWGIPTSQLLESLNVELKQVANPNGRLSSADVFIKSDDEKFFIKDVKTGLEGLKMEERRVTKNKPRAEVNFFELYFRDYCQRMIDERKMGKEHSLLPKYFALFGLKDNRYGIEGMERIFLVTNSLFPEKAKDPLGKQKEIGNETKLKFEYKFDLKGSLDHQKLSAKKRQRNDGKDPTFRYLDLFDESEAEMDEEERASLEKNGEGCFFRNGILLGDDTYRSFVGILERDSKFSMKRGRTDYSLLLGVTFDRLNDEQKMEFKNQNPNIMEATCEDCSADRGATYSRRIDEFAIFPGVIDMLAQFNWRKTIDLVNRVVVREETDKSAKSAIAPGDYYFRFMCALSTKVFRPMENKDEQLEKNKKKFCKKIIEEPHLENLRLIG